MKIQKNIKYKYKDKDKYKLKQWVDSSGGDRAGGKYRLTSSQGSASHCCCNIILALDTNTSARTDTNTNFKHDSTNTACDIANQHNQGRHDFLRCKQIKSAPKIYFLLLVSDT